MRENNHKISEEAIMSIKSIKDEDALTLASETREGINPFYHTIGTMGGISVRNKYSTVDAMRNEEKVTPSTTSNKSNREMQ